MNDLLRSMLPALCVALVAGPMPAQNDSQRAAPEGAAARRLIELSKRDDAAGIARIAADDDVDAFGVVCALLGSSVTGHAKYTPQDVLAAARRFAAAIPVADGRTYLIALIASWSDLDSPQRARRERLIAHYRQVRVHHARGESAAAIAAGEAAAGDLMGEVEPIAILVRYEFATALRSRALASADAEFARARADAAAIGWRRQVAHIDYARAGVLLEQGDVLRAARACEALLPRLVRDRRLVPATLARLGKAQWIAQERQAAEQSFAQAIATGELLADVTELAKVLEAIGECLRLDGDPRAASVHARLREVHLERGDRARAASALGRLAEAAKAGGDFARACALVSQSIAELTAIRADEAAAKAQLSLAQLLVEDGRLSAALECYKAARETLSARGSDHAVLALVGVGTSLVTLGQRRAGLDALYGAAAEAKALSVDFVTCWVHDASAAAYMNMGLWDDAAASAAVAKAIYERNGNWAGVAQCLAIEAGLAKERGDYGANVRLLEAAVAMAPDGRKSIKTKLRGLLCKGLQLAGSQERARGVLDELRADLGDGARDRLLLGSLLLGIDASAAAAELDAALASYRGEHDDVDVGDAHRLLAQAKLALGDFAGVAEHAEEAIAALSTGTRLLGDAESRRVGAFVSQACGLAIVALGAVGPRGGASDAHYERMFWFLETGRARRLADTMQNRARKGQATVHVAMADTARAALEAAKTKAEHLAETGADRTLLRKARAAVDAAFLAAERANRDLELRQRLDSDWIDAEPIGLDKLASVLPERTAFVSFVDLPGRQAAVVVRHGATAFVELCTNAGLIPTAETWVRTLSAGVAAGPSEADLAARIYDLIFRPLLPALGDAERLVVSPSGYLAELPLEACAHCDASGRSTRIVESFEISYAASASLYARRRERRPAASGVIAVGDPAYPDSDDTQTRHGIGKLRRLPKSGDEARDVTACYADQPHVLLLREQATVANLRRALATYPRCCLVHLACHARSDARRPEFSEILLSGGETLCYRDIASLDLDADLVCLSACETAAGIYVQGEATMSLARAFLVAGARQVVASRWRVADADTHAFMRDLHGLVARGVAPAAALRAVKCAWLARASGVVVWVPFVLWVA